MQETIERRTRESKAEFLQAFEITNGIITQACIAAGINRKTFYRWRDSDPDFAAAVSDILHSQNDYVESLLLEHINQKNLKAIQFYLGAKHPDYNKRIVKAEVSETRTLEDLIDESRRTHQAIVINEGLVVEGRQTV